MIVQGEGRTVPRALLGVGVCPRKVIGRLTLAGAVAQFLVVRRRMRTFRIILVVAVVMAFVLGLFWLLPIMFESHYTRLQHKSGEYYAELAAACDSILVEHPLGTNGVIWIPVTDPSLPKVVRDLHPIKLQVNPQRVWMLLDSNSRAGIGLEWQPKWDDTNLWKLDIVAESLETVIYSAERPAPPHQALQQRR